MLENQGDIVEWLRAKSFTENDIQQLSQLLQRHVHQDVKQSGTTNVAIAEGNDVHVGDRYIGTSIEEIRTIIQELNTFQTSQINLSFGKDSYKENISDSLLLARIILDPRLLETINFKLNIIEEIFHAGYFSESQQQELFQLKQQLYTFRNLNQDLQNMAIQGDYLIQSAVEAMRQKLEICKLRSKDITEAVRTEISPKELECRQTEDEILENFVNRLENSRFGAAWIDSNIIFLTQYAWKEVHKQLPSINLTEREIEAFQFSVEQFLEQIAYCLYRGTYDILDSPEISLVLDKEIYEIAFKAIKDSIPNRLRDEIVQEIKECINYLLERFSFY